MSTALVIAHDHLSGAGLLAAALEDAGFTIQNVLVVPEDRFGRPDVAVEFPELTGIDLVVPLGAPWSVYDLPRVGSWVLAEQEYLRAADAAGVPVLGVCFGGQLLAAAHGGRVALAAAPEIGWFTVRSDAPALIEDGPWLEWHFDSWAAPSDAIQLAHSDRAPQAFRLRRNLAIQFHPEVDEKILLGWLDNGGADSARANGVDPDALLAETAAREAEAAARAERLVRRFLDQVATA